MNCNQKNQKNWNVDIFAIGNIFLKMFIVYNTFTVTELATGKTNSWMKSQKTQRIQFLAIFQLNQTYVLQLQHIKICQQKFLSRYFVYHSRQDSANKDNIPAPVRRFGYFLAIETIANHHRLASET